MKKNVVILALATLLAIPNIFAAKTDDPIVMTIGEIKVPLSEFEYLYKKNNAQQSSSTSLDEYVDMFVNYKLKVCAALDARIDTTASYVADMGKFREELARPYLRDKNVDDSLAQVAYAHMKENVGVYHLMLGTGKTDAEIKQQQVLADSLRALLVGGADFGELVNKYSIDQGSRRNGGKMGYIPAGRLPYVFEDAAYNTPVGGIAPVVKTKFGYHIIKVYDRRPDKGQVKARHILKLTQGLDSAQCVVKKAEIDSIYSLLVAGADFVTVAKNTTEDPSGRNSGGELPWFGVGQMISEFETAAFSMNDGQISKPIKTAFGYHIILRENSRMEVPFDEVKDRIYDAIKSDERSTLAHKRAVETYCAANKITINKKSSKIVERIFTDNGGLNSKSRELLAKSNGEAFKVGKEKTTIAQIASHLDDRDMSAAEAYAQYVEVLNDIFQSTVTADMKSSLDKREPDYRNLINEYSDGLLLYEISNQQVWNRPNTDSAGMEDYFQKHRSEFVWDTPHYRGYVLSAETDSVADAAIAYLKDGNFKEEELATSLRKKFGNNAKVEKVIVGKGDNAIVDYVGFGATRPEAKGRWAAFRAFRGEILSQPQSALDVRGAVSMQYQQYLEEEWVVRLRTSYPIIVNREAINRAFNIRK